MASSARPAHDVSLQTQLGTSSAGKGHALVIAGETRRVRRKAREQGSRAAQQQRKAGGARVGLPAGASMQPGGITAGFDRANWLFEVRRRRRRPVGGTSSQLRRLQEPRARSVQLSSGGSARAFNGQPWFAPYHFFARFQADRIGELRDPNSCSCAKLLPAAAASARSGRSHPCRPAPASAASREGAAKRRKLWRLFTF